MASMHQQPPTPAEALPETTTPTCGSRMSPVTRRWTGCARATNRRWHSSAMRSSSGCAPRRSRCSTPTPASRTWSAAASTSTTSGATPTNPRGLWRRTTLDSYRTRLPEWDVLIDVDELGGRRRETGCGPAPSVIDPEYTLALVSLSRGGSDAAIVREFDMATSAIRRRRIHAAGGEVADRLGGRRHRPGRYGLRRRLAHRLRLSADRQAVAPRHAADRRGNRVRGRPHRRRVSGVGGSHSRLRAHPRWAGHRLLERRDLRTARHPGKLRADPDRRAHRRERVGTPRMAADRAAHRLVRTAPSATRAGSLLAADYDEFLAGTAELSGDVRARRAHRAAPLRVDPRTARCWSPLADVASRVEMVTPGSWQREPYPVSRQRPHRRSSPPTTRRRVLPGLQRIRHARRGCCVAPAPAARARSSPRRRSSTPKTSRCTAFRGFARTAHRFRTSWCARTGAGARARPCCTATAASNPPTPRPTAACRPAVAGPWRHLRAGQHPRRRRVRAEVAHPGDARGPAQGGRGLRRRGNDLVEPRHHHRRRSSARRAAATAACSWASC